MGNNTAIQWTDATVNFWTGCKKVSPGCKYCYMYRDKERYGLDGSVVKQVKPSTVQTILKNLSGPSRIFTCSWSDFFIEEADEWRNDAWDIIRAHPQHQWQILTKRPERIQQCLPWDWGAGWPNVWLGVSVESINETHRIETLQKIPAKIRFLSIEPLIGPFRIPSRLKHNYKIFDGGEIHWIIVGGESGNDNGKYLYRPCEGQWIYDIIMDCKMNKIPVFIKQMGTYIAKNNGYKDRHGGDIEEWPKQMQIREFPLY